MTSPEIESTNCRWMLATEHMVHVITIVTKLFCTTSCNWLMQVPQLQVWLQKAESEDGVSFVTMSCNVAIEGNN